MQNFLKSHLVTRCRDSLRKTERLILEQGTSGILEAWTLFLWETAEDLGDVEDTLNEVEARLKQKEQEVRGQIRIFLSVVAVVSAVTVRVPPRSANPNTCKKPKNIHRFQGMEVRSEIVQRFNHLFRKKPSKKAVLMKENESLLEEIERQKELISQLEEALKEANNKLVEESEKSFEEGVKVGRNVAAVEELGVLEELEILKQIESMIAGDDTKYPNCETEEESKAFIIEINTNQEL